MKNTNTKREEKKKLDVILGHKSESWIIVVVEFNLWFRVSLWFCVSELPRSLPPLSFFILFYCSVTAFWWQKNPSLCVMLNWCVLQFILQSCFLFCTFRKSKGNPQLLSHNSLILTFFFFFPDAWGFGGFARFEFRFHSFFCNVVDLLWMFISLFLFFTIVVCSGDFFNGGNTQAPPLFNFLFKMVLS